MRMRTAVAAFLAADFLLLLAAGWLYLHLDRTAPVIAFAEGELVFSEDVEILLEGVSATDDVDGDVTDSLLVEKISETTDGDRIVTYVAVDSSNNVAKKSRIYKVDGEQTEQQKDVEANKRNEQEK